MSKPFCDIMEESRKLQISTSSYFSVCDFIKILKELKNEVIHFRDDSILMPFVIIESRVFELYDYELNIRRVCTPSLNKFLTMKTGKKISIIDPPIRDRISSCYIEIPISDPVLSAAQFLDFVIGIIESPRFKTRVVEAIGHYNLHELYFEHY